MNDLPPSPRNAKVLLVKADTYEALRQAAKSQIIPDEQDFVTRVRNGKKLMRLRQRPDELTKKNHVIFHPIARLRDNAWQINIAEGYVIARNVVDLPEANQYDFILPDNIFDENDDPVWLSITAGQSVYVSYDTNKDGTIKAEPKARIEVTTRNADSNSFYPAVGDYEGRDGMYRIKICDFDVESNRPKLEMFHVGDHVLHMIERVTMENLPIDTEEAGGDIYPVLKTYKEDLDHVQFRSLRQVSGEGEPLIAPLAESETLENKETIDIRRIAERETGDVAIRVKTGDEGRLIRIEGNGFDATESGWVIKDGLVFNIGAGGCEDGGTGRIEMIEEGASTGVNVLQWENGCVKTNIEFQIVVRELMVCEDGVPVARKFLTVEAIPTPTPPPP